MRLSMSLVLVVGLTLVMTEAKRFGGGGGKRRPSGGSSRPKPAPAPRPKPTEQHDFLNAERGHSGGHTSNQSPQGNKPIGFEQFGNNHGTQTQHKPIGFDKVNSEVQNRPGGSFTPSAPNYPAAGTQVGPPPAYHPQGQGQAPHYGGMEHPPAYPGRPPNAPPVYTPNQPQYNPFPYHGQQNYGNNPYQGQGQYHGQQNYGNNFGTSYPQQPSFGNYGQGYHPSYPTQSYGGSPFGGSGYNGNPYYSPNNFGYSSNPGYFGQGYHEKKSRFGGLPIPIPIPIPIPFGGGFGGGYGSGYGSGYGHSYNHRLLNTFIKDKDDKSTTDNSTSVFVLNNSTVTPCTTDHFSYGKVNVTAVACTAETCTGVKLTTITKMGDVESRHSTWLTMCLENNVTFTVGGDKVDPSVSELHNETISVCKNMTDNSTTLGNTTTEDATTTPTTSNTTVCELVNCSWVEMCMTPLEIVDDCSGSKCPFRRQGYRPCVTVKMCRSASNPMSTFASLNTTLYSVDEYDLRQSHHHASNLTLISYHPPVIVFTPNCSQNASAPGCPVATPAPGTSQTPAPCPAGSTPVLDTTAGTTSCSPATNSTPAVTDVAVATPETSNPPPTP